MCGIGLIIENAKIIVNKDCDIKQKNIHYLSFKEKKNLQLKDLENKIFPRGPNFISSISMNLNNNFQCIISFVASVLFIRGKGTKQPLQDENGNILLWNGEIFNGIHIDPEENDTEILLKMLTSCNSCINENHISNIMSKIEGPWAFIYWEKSTKSIWFGRNFLGQRSLLIHLPNEICSSFCISSVAFGNYYENIIEENQNILNKKENSIEEEIIWQEIPTNGIFCLTIDESNNNNIEFILKEYKWKKDLEYYPFGKRDKIIPIENVINSPLDDILDQFLFYLNESVKIRVSNLPIAKDNNPNSARLGILFSGGIDSMILAVLADKFIPLEQPIDLLNVAFGIVINKSNKKKDKNNVNTFDSSISFDVPDRKTGLNGFLELKHISKRKWNFIQINVNQNEIQLYKERIFSLIYPRQTVMDMTIGTALWFASRGLGIVEELNNCNKKEYISHAKVLLNGLGADEQFGGYSRYRTTFKFYGWEGLQKELEKDFNRLWKRNLGRDDRVISDHGREARFPYLDENLITFINKIPLWNICNLTESAGIGDKKLLRELGKKIGLTNSIHLTKKAIQFGTGINKTYFPNISSNKIDGTSLFLNHS